MRKRKVDVSWVPFGSHNPMKKHFCFQEECLTAAAAAASPSSYYLSSPYYVAGMCSALHLLTLILETTMRDRRHYWWWNKDWESLCLTLRCTRTRSKRAITQTWPFRPMCAFLLSGKTFLREVHWEKHALWPWVGSSLAHRDIILF